MRAATDVDNQLCNFLKQGREARGLSVGDLSRATKIKEHSLELLEAGAWGQLPAEVFVIGFVKAYAREVGLDGAEALRRYRKERGAPHDAPAAEYVDPGDGQSDGPLHGRRFGVALVVFLILIVATLTLSLLLRHSAPAGGMSRLPQTRSWSSSSSG